MRNKRSSDVLARLKLITATGTDAHLSEVLGVSPQTLSSWKGRESIPYAICIDLAEERGISLDWLLMGQGPMLRCDIRATSAQMLAASPLEQQILELFRSLNEGDQRFIQIAVEEKRRLGELEQRLDDLTQSVQSA